MAPEQQRQEQPLQPRKRPGQPEEVAPCSVFLASGDSSYMAGQMLHPNGGEVVNG
jgi:NAD(P)-dependent dehydrogenase (short-subunit alcohol dehydrogenase family)